MRAALVCRVDTKGRRTGCEVRMMDIDVSAGGDDSGAFEGISDKDKRVSFVLEYEVVMSLFSITLSSYSLFWGYFYLKLSLFVTADAIEVRK